MSAVALLHEPCGVSDDDVREFYERQYLQVRRLPEHRPGDPAGAAGSTQRIPPAAGWSLTMQSFHLVRVSDRSAAIAAGADSATAQQGASVRFLAGGTTLVDLMKLGVERPERVVDITRLGLDEIVRREMTIYSSARPHATAIWRITGSCGPTAPRFRKRSSPAHRSNCAMPQRRRAICCSGHAACIFATSLVPATSASPARAVRRLPAQIACWPFWVLATHALRTTRRTWRWQ